jgi:hypothetical protein
VSSGWLSLQIHLTSFTTGTVEREIMGSQRWAHVPELDSVPIDLEEKKRTLGCGELRIEEQAKNHRRKCPHLISNARQDLLEKGEKKKKKNSLSVSLALLLILPLLSQCPREKNRPQAKRRRPLAKTERSLGRQNSKLGDGLDRDFQ